MLLYVITSTTVGIPLIGGYLREADDGLAILLLIISSMNEFYSPEARSVQYYRAGRDLQELHDEYENFVNLDIANLDRDVNDAVRAEVNRRLIGVLVPERLMNIKFVIGDFEHVERNLGYIIIIYF